MCTRIFVRKFARLSSKGTASTNRASRRMDGLDAQANEHMGKGRKVFIGK